MIGPEKTLAEVQAMRDGGRILATIFRDLKLQVHAGVSERELDAWVAKEIIRYGAIATYRTREVNFPGVICISVNEKVVHGVPSDYVLEDGDIVSFDLVLTYGGMKTDSAFTMVVGDKPNSVQKHLINATERSLYAGIDAIKGPVHVGDISAAIEAVLVKAKLGIVRDLVGHGIGHQMHQAPDEIPNYGRKGTGLLLVPGETIAIEPMTTLGNGKVKEDADGWTYVSRDSTLAAHFEHTIMITETGAEIFTML